MSLPGRDRQMQIGEIGGLRAPRIDGNNGDFLGVSQLALLDALKNHRMTVGGIGADQQEAIGTIDVGVRRRRPVRAEGGFVAEGRRRHAQPRIGVEVVRAEKPFGELVGDVILLGRQLPGAVKRDGFRTMLVDDRAKTPGEIAHRLFPARALEVTVLAGSYVRIEQAVAGFQSFRQIDRFETEIAAARWMIRIALDASDRSRLNFRQKTAADTAIRAI